MYSPSLGFMDSRWHCWADVALPGSAGVGVRLVIFVEDGLFV